MVPLTELDEGLGFFALEDSEIQAPYAPPQSSSNVRK